MFCSLLKISAPRRRYTAVRHNELCNSALGGRQHAEVLARGANADLESAPTSIVAIKLLRKGYDVGLRGRGGSRGDSHDVASVRGERRKAVD
jgi:hypothetical protein